MLTNYLVVYRNNLDRHQSFGEKDAVRLAFDDTVEQIALNESISRLNAREYLNGIIPLANSDRGFKRRRNE